MLWQKYVTMNIKFFLLNKKCLRYSNKIQSKNYKIETSEIKKCLCYAFKIKYILKNGNNGLALGYWS